MQTTPIALDRPERTIIPQDWERRPELLPALRILVEGARRAVVRKQQQRAVRQTGA